MRVADKVIGDRVCERGRTLNHGVHVWPLDITKREKSKLIYGRLAVLVSQACFPGDHPRETSGTLGRRNGRREGEKAQMGRETGMSGSYGNRAVASSVSSVIFKFCKAACLQPREPLIELIERLESCAPHNVRKACSG